MKMTLRSCSLITRLRWTYMKFQPGSRCPNAQAALVSHAHASAVSSAADCCKGKFGRPISSSRRANKHRSCATDQAQGWPQELDPAAPCAWSGSRSSTRLGRFRLSFLHCWTSASCILGSDFKSLSVEHCTLSRDRALRMPYSNRKELLCTVSTMPIASPWIGLWLEFSTPAEREMSD